MELSRAQKHCPVANICEMNTPEAPACGSDTDHFSPLVIAESMCTRALAGRILFDAEEVKRRPVCESDREAALAWYELECGIAERDTEKASRHFDASSEHTNNAMDRSYSWFSGKYSAALLEVYRPLFIERKQHISPTYQKLQAIRQGLCIVYDALIDAPVHTRQFQHILDAIAEDRPHRPCLGTESRRKGYAAKLVGMALAARQGILLYPASDREAFG